MAYYLRKENKKKGTYLQMYESHWDKEKKQPPVFRRSTRKVPSFSSRHFFISFPASRFFLYLQQIFNALLGLFLLKKFF